MPQNELLTPKSDTTSTESSTTSPPERALSETSSGVHSSEETNKDEVVIRRAAVAAKTSIIKQAPAVIHEEPYGRITHMKMSTFKDGSNSNTLPTRVGDNNSMIDYSQCNTNTMPLPPSVHQIHRVSMNEPKRTTLPNNIRYSAGQYIRQMSQLKNAESPYGMCGLGSGHHTFSKLIQNDVTPSINTMPSSHSHQNYVSDSQIQHQPMNNFQTASSSFSTFNNALHNTSHYGMNTEHNHNSKNNNNNIYSQNILQLH